MQPSELINPVFHYTALLCQKMNSDFHDFIIIDSSQINILKIIQKQWFRYYYFTVTTIVAYIDIINVIERKLQLLQIILSHQHLGKPLQHLFTTSHRKALKSYFVTKHATNYLLFFKMFRFFLLNKRIKFPQVAVLHHQTEFLIFSEIFNKLQHIWMLVTPHVSSQ